MTTISSKLTRFMCHAIHSASRPSALRCASTSRCLIGVNLQICGSNAVLSRRFHYNPQLPSHNSVPHQKSETIMQGGDEGSNGSWRKKQERAKARIDEVASDLNQVSQEIWSHPELGYKEHHAHRVLTDFLEKEGFEVTRNYHLETAFKATYGSDDGVHVCVICEYDALPEIGHACGHNLIAEAGAGAGVGIKAALALDETPVGRVTVLGTPAEEGAGGKIKLIEAGVFEGMDTAMMTHPYATNVTRCTALSMLPLTIHYSGLAAHAAAAPWEGLNALDAAVMCYSSISVMRQQFKPDWRAHGIFTNGGAKPNIVPEEAELEYYLRAPNNRQMDVLKEKIAGCANGAAIATGCKVNITYGTAYANMIHNDVMSTSYEDHCAGLGLVYPPELRGAKGGSTDMGDVSYVLPSIHPKFAIPTTSSTHNIGFTESVGKSEAQPPTLLQSKAMALTCLDLLDPASGMVDRAKREFEDTIKSLDS